jgi:NitT/TauT family transport system substrate-binding protein
MPYYATHETLERQSRVLEAFLRAAGRGWELAYRETERAVGVLVEEYPILRYEDEMVAARELLTYVFTEKTREGGFATMDRETWQEQIASHAELGQFTRRVPSVDDVMTLSVLEATKDKRPHLGAS